MNTEIRLIIVFSVKDGEALYSQQKQDRELTCSDHEFLNDKFILKLKKVGKTTKPFRYDLNQIPYDCTVEVTNRSGRQSVWRTMDRGSWHCTGGTDQDHPQNKKCKKAKWLSEEALQITEKRREAKGKREKERYTYLNA